MVQEVYNTRGHPFLATADIEVGFASTKKATDVQYDQDALADIMTNTFGGQILAPGQRLLLDVRNVPLSLTVKSVSLGDPSELVWAFQFGRASTDSKSSHGENVQRCPEPQRSSCARHAREDDEHRYVVKHLPSSTRRSTFGCAHEPGSTGFYKAAGAPINLTGSSKRAAANSIITPE